MTNPQDSWYLLTHSEPKELNKASQQLHHASQFVAVTGYNLFPEASDDSHTNMEWLPEIKALASQEVETRRRFRAALIFETFELQFIDPDYNVLGTFPLSGQTKTTAMSFVRTQINALGGNRNDVKKMTHFELPDHPTKNGGPFVMIDPKHHQELARYRNNAHVILQEFQKMFEHATEVRTWPHHFDTGSFIPVAFNDLAEPTKSVGIGMAVADDKVDEFYYYVNLWSKDEKPDLSDLPNLNNGKWHTDKWKGATLPISEVIKETSEKRQWTVVWEFLSTAINASFKTLGAEAMKV